MTFPTSPSCLESRDGPVLTARLRVSSCSNDCGGKFCNKVFCTTAVAGVPPTSTNFPASAKLNLLLFNALARSDVIVATADVILQIEEFDIDEELAKLSDRIKIHIIKSITSSCIIYSSRCLLWYFIHFNFRFSRIFPPP